MTTAPPRCTKRGHQYPEVKRPCPNGCVNHARECPQRTGGGWHFTRDKGVKAGQGKATLTLALPAPLITQLRAHRLQQTAERLAAGSAWQDWDLIFCTPTGSPVNSHDDWEDWHALLAEASVRTARVHDARHTAATLLLEQGIDIRRCPADPRPLPAQPDPALHPRHRSAEQERRRPHERGTVGLSTEAWSQNSNCNPKGS